MASIHYWDYHGQEIREALKLLGFKKGYHETTDSEMRKVKRLASKLIKDNK